MALTVYEREGRALPKVTIICKLSHSVCVTFRQHIVHGEIAPGRKKIALQTSQNDLKSKSDAN